MVLVWIGDDASNEAYSEKSILDYPAMVDDSEKNVLVTIEEKAEQDVYALITDFLVMIAY